MILALIGNPNAGKTSVFNHLTGMRQKTGNFPGVTVDKKTGGLTLPDGTEATIIDLPGAYSLYPNSMDERIATDILCNRNSASYPALALYVADVNNLERHLLLCSQLIDLEIPVLLALTMTDIAETNGLHCAMQSLAEELGVEIVQVNGRTGSGITELISRIPAAKLRKSKRFSDTRSFAPQTVDALKKIFPDENDYSALLLAHHHQRFDFINASQKNEISRITTTGFNSLQLQVQETLARYEKITALLRRAVTQEKKNEQETFTEKIDKLLTHRVFGSLIFLAVLFFVFQAIFAWATYPMEWIDSGFSELGSLAKTHLPHGVINDLLTEGILPGLSGICIFIPQITILFALIIFLEDVGYMSRTIFLSDSIMRKFGLNGRSIVSLFSGLACAVPAIMTTRTITNWKERLITIMVTPLMSCSARIPVYTILVALVIPGDSSIAFFDMRGLLMLGLYMLGVFAALISAFVLKKIIKTNEQSYLVMELPSYKIPNWKNIAFTVFEKVKIFVTQAGKVIFIISIVLWFLASYGPKKAMGEAENIPVSLTNETLTQEQVNDIIAARKMQASYAGQLGRFIEPVIEPLGFDWKIGIALITSFAAREVFVGTIATLYSVGREQSDESILEKMRSEINPQTGLQVFTPAVVFSLLIFYVFAMQCMSTIAVVKRETKSWKWAGIQFVYMTALAYVASFITYQLMS
ncbi:MAG: ferrous iron transport protein B [Chitinophagales bacterium]|nr:ferrous iron transport protein B [Chitinophagales bacterium]